MSNTIGNRLNSAMKLRGLTQTDIINKTGITKGALSSYLSGRYEPKNTNIYKLAKALDVNPVWLMGYDVSKEIDKIKELEKDEENYQVKIMNNYFKELSEDQQKDVINYIKFLKSKN